MVLYGQMTTRLGERMRVFGVLVENCSRGKVDDVCLVIMPSFEDFVSDMKCGSVGMRYTRAKSSPLD